MSASNTANLFINGQNVGSVDVLGSDSAWGYGLFHPLDAFATFAPFFGAWSLLMHADDAASRLSRTAALELRRAEVAIDHLSVELRWPLDHTITRIAQLNIDGETIEWKRADG